MILSELQKLYKAHRDSHLNNEDFLERYSVHFSNVRVGCSFNPEHWVFDRTADTPYGYEQGSTLSNNQQELILKAAEFIVEDLKMKDIRLSIRWSQIYKSGELNLEYYYNLFKYFLNQDVNICLNIGPIKTMRWPEEQVPKEVLNELNKIPAHGSLLTSDDELAAKSKEYFIQLINLLKETYSQEELNKIKVFQTNNECFNRFGEYGWTFDSKLESEYINIANEHFPERHFLLNSSGRNDMQKNLALAKMTGIPLEKFIMGYNYYYKVPGQAENFILKYMDNLTLVLPGKMSTKRLKDLSKKIGFKIEVSELQGEPWLHLQSPGNSIQEFRFTLLRSVNSMLNLNSSEPSVIRYWGIEDLVFKKLSEQATKVHEEIFELIREIN